MESSLHRKNLRFLRYFDKSSGHIAPNTQSIYQMGRLLINGTDEHFLDNGKYFIENKSEEIYKKLDLKQDGRIRVSS